MSAHWKAISDYPFDDLGIGPLVMISFVRDGGRTTRMAYAKKDSKGKIAWHGSEPLPVGSVPDIWLDGTPWSSAERPDYTSAIARKIEELTANGGPRRDREAISLEMARLGHPAE